MSAPTNHWKLGLFVVIGVTACVAAIGVFGARSMRTESVPYVTYFDESVQGLEVGAPVKFRGVTIGSVSAIDLAGDRRHVAATYGLGVKVLNSLGLAARRQLGAKTRLVIPSDLRVQLVSSGLTGVKFVQMDFFDEQSNPPLVLPFEVPDNYIPAVASMMKSLETSVVSAVERFPELTNQLEVVLQQLSVLIGEVSDARLAEKVAEALAALTGLIGHANAALTALDSGALSVAARGSLQNLNEALGAVTKVVARLDGDKGLTASIQRTSETVGALAQDANHVGPELEETLKAVKAAAVSVQRLANQLENDPDMLLKGRAKGASR
jgi:ABC-type transporter Mla subunit MlaD